MIHWLLDQRFRYALSWLLLLTALAARTFTAWTNFENHERVDGNEGHTSIDFAGQWLLGRMLVTGHGHELYSRERHLELARQAYSHEREKPNQEVHDAENLISCYPGPSRERVGGPLYPPIHALVMAPLGSISDPIIAYRVGQVFMFLMIGLAGLGVRYLTRGRWWWTVATALLLLAPGGRGSLDLGQNRALTIALLIWGWALIVRGHVSWGGVLWGLLAFKPVWAVSFVGALLLLQQWRAFAAMVFTGVAAILITLPLMGTQVWFDWLHVGKMATATYCVDRNWIFLSRDLFGVPRRMLLTFENGRALEDRPLAALVGWGLWLSVALLTLFTVFKRRRSDLTGPFPAFVFCAAWLCTYRFMYYDSLLGMLAVVVLLAEPRRYFAKGRWWPLVFVALMYVIENITVPLNVEVTASFKGWRKLTSDGQPPTMYFASGDDYPWDTLAVFLLWVRCGWMVWRKNLTP